MPGKNAAAFQYDTPTPVPSIGVPTPGPPLATKTLPYTGLYVPGIILAGLIILIIGLILRRDTKRKEKEAEDGE